VIVRRDLLEGLAGHRHDVPASDLELEESQVDFSR